MSATPRTALLLAAWAIGLAALAGCSLNPVTGKRELILISREQEIALGADAAPDFEKEFGGKVASEPLQQYIRALGAKIAAVSDRPMPYEYTLLASDVPNAFALPGGKIYITAGLMKAMTNERQLAAVLAHETAHVAARHSVKQMQKQMGAQLLLEIASRAGGADTSTAAADIGKVVATMALLKYSRDDEYQADQVGIEYAARAGYNPWGMVELLHVLLNMQEQEPGRLEEMFQTHPLSSKRLEKARAILTGNPAYDRWSPDAPDPGATTFQRMRQALVHALTWRRGASGSRLGKRTPLAS